jgi:glucose/arabinose dehydrogenase
MFFSRKALFSARIYILFLGAVLIGLRGSAEAQRPGRAKKSLKIDRIALVNLLGGVFAEDVDSLSIPYPSTPFTLQVWPSRGTRSVRFYLGGRSIRIVNGAPYTMNGKSKAGVLPWTFGTGVFQITVVPYSGRKAKGRKGRSRKFSLSFIPSAGGGDPTPAPLLTLPPLTPTEAPPTPLPTAPLLTTPTPSPSPSVTTSAIPTSVPTETPSPLPTATSTPLPTSSLLPTLTPTAVPSFSLRLRAGTTSYVDTEAREWIPDEPYVTGATTVYPNPPITSDIQGTNDDPLYQLERFGGDFGYEIPVENGNYQVTLHFAEIFHGNSGERLIDAIIEGVPVLNAFDIVDAGGSFTAVARSFVVAVADSTLTISLLGVVDNAKISALEIVRTSGLPLPTPSATPSPRPTATPTPAVSPSPTPSTTIQFAPRILADTSTPGLEDLANPTSLAMGPDGKLYVAQQDGLIHVLTMNEMLEVTSVQTVRSIYLSPTFDANGAPATGVVGRQVTGIYVDPSSNPSAPVLYVSHSDPRIGANNNNAALLIDTDGGVLTRLTGPNFDSPSSRKDLIVGLPRSRENHSPNGIQKGNDGWLYMAIGGNTNYGGKSLYFSDLPEVNLSAVIVRLNLAALPTNPVDVSAGSAVGSGVGDGEYPGIFEVYATGYRNAYDILWHSNGSLYANLNGGNNGLGNTPSTDEGCTGVPSINPGFYPDTLDLVLPGGYGGHPHASRGYCIFGDGSLYSPPRTPHPQFVSHVYNYPGASSSNGMVEYKSLAFGGAMLGDIITAVTFGTTPDVRRVRLSADGTSVVESTSIASSLEGPIDVEMHPSGALFVAEFLAGRIAVLVPQSSNTPNDNDGDGIIDSLDPDDDNDLYTDIDEIASGTNPRNPADRPLDSDGDLIGDETDPDDDNDTLLDVSDRFRLDSSNGAATLLPLLFEWNPGDQALGGFKKSGFTGILGDGQPSKFRPAAVSVGAAGGFLSLVPGQGEMLGGTNDLENGLHVGLDARPQSGLGVFTVETRLTQPFSSPPVPPQGTEAAGAFVGLDQDNFIRIELGTASGEAQTGIRVKGELNGLTVGNTIPTIPLVLPYQGNVDVALTVDSLNQEIRASYRIGGTAFQTLAILRASEFPQLTSLFVAELGGGIFATRGASTTSQFIAVFDYFRIYAGLPEGLGSATASATFSVLTPDTVPTQSTYNTSSFTVFNGSTAGQEVTKVRVDLRTSVLQDLVFDPLGLAGDSAFKAFTLDASPAGATFVPTYRGAHDDGFDVLDIDTSGLLPGQAMAFSIDVDPTSIRGTPPPGPLESGSVGAAELVGSMVTVYFDDGTAVTRPLSPQSSATQFSLSQAELSLRATSIPTVSLSNALSRESFVPSSAQTLTLSGKPLSVVQIYQVNGTLALSGIGFDIDPFETNTAVSALIAEVTLGADGTATFPVTIPSGAANVTTFATGYLRANGYVDAFAPLLRAKVQ